MTTSDERADDRILLVELLEAERESKQRLVEAVRKELPMLGSKHYSHSREAGGPASGCPACVDDLHTAARLRRACIEAEGGES